jgi:CheY-like chemotaxis protein
MPGNSSARRPRALVVEDEILVAINTEDALVDLGFDIAGTATYLGEAVRLAREEALDLAVLDVNLNGEMSFPAARILRARGIPFLFATGYGLEGVDPALADAPTLRKPYRLSELRRAIAQATAMQD